MGICMRIRKRLARRLLGKNYIILPREEYEALQKIKQEYRIKLSDYERRLEEAEINTREYMYLKKFVSTLVELEHELHSIDDADMIIRHTLRKACEFYGADWSGFLDVDTVMGVWSPYRWYNPGTKDETKERMAEFESIDCMKRWMECMDANCPIFIPDVEVIKEQNPEEYAMYRKLRAKAILAVPVYPRPMGFMVVRNPAEHMSAEESDMLQMFAYVMLTNINDKKSTEMLMRAHSADDLAPNEVRISMFGELRIKTAGIEVTEKEINAPDVVCMIVYLLLSGRKSCTSRDISEILKRDNMEVDFKNAAGNLRTQMSRTRKAMKSSVLEDLMLSDNKNGYYLNDKYTITTDVGIFKECLLAIGQTNSMLDKVDLMKKAVNIYCGDLLQSAAGEHWLMPEATQYHLAYIGIINDLLRTFDSMNEYSNIQKYAEQSLKVAPGNMKAYYWLYVAYNHMSTPEYARTLLKRAKDALTEPDYEDLLAEMQKYSENPM